MWDARLGAVLHRDGERVGQRSGCTVIGEAHLGVQTVLYLVDFEGMCRLVECALDVFGELSATHVLDLMIVIYLRSDQCEDRKEHQCGGYPNCPPFHTANIVNFGWSQNLVVYTSCKNSIFYRRVGFDLLFWQVLSSRRKTIGSFSVKNEPINETCRARGKRVDVAKIEHCSFGFSLFSCFLLRMERP